jgi:hypothetical protein
VIRLILLLLLVIVVLAIRYLPWWALILIPTVIFLLFYFLRGRLVTAVFSIPFRMKGKVLRGATATVHSIRAIPKPTTEDDLDSVDSDEHGNELSEVYEYYELDVTIRPKLNKGPFHFWDPDELLLTVPGYSIGSNDDNVCSILECKVIPCEVLQAERRVLLESTSQNMPPATTDDHDGQQEAFGNNEDTETEVSQPDAENDEADDFGGKYFGPLRLKIQLGLQPGIKQLVFNYYFEKFGSVMIP